MASIGFAADPVKMMTSWVGMVVKEGSRNLKEAQFTGLGGTFRRWEGQEWVLGSWLPRLDGWSYQASRGQGPRSSLGGRGSSWGPLDGGAFEIPRRYQVSSWM